MNPFDYINSAIDLYIGYFWFFFPLTVYLGLEFNNWKIGQTYIIVRLYQKYKAWRTKE